MRPNTPVLTGQLFVFLLLCAVVLSTPASLAELITPPTPLDDHLIEADHIKLQISVNADVTLTGSGKGDELRATVRYVPAAAEELTVVPEPLSRDPLTFAWKGVSAGKYSYQYDALVDNYAERVRISKAIAYPYVAPADIAPYLQPQEFTDTNQDIKTLASQLVGNEKDATRVVHKIASWTRTNIRYDLNSIAADASEQSTWVMANREGVCDELTALFISLSREAGIPARFVSGMAYTTLTDFPEPWQAHGWAEVWLPDYGWVPVDVTYGEVFWLDATHIPIIKSADARNTAADYSLRARDLSLQPSPLKTEVSVLDSSGSMREPLVAKLDAQYRRTGSESGNVLIASITNNAPHTVVTDVALATTADIVVHDPRSQMILLPAGATRLVRWRVTMPSYDPGYEYTVPFGVLIQRGGNATLNISGATRDLVYPLPPMETGTDENVLVRCSTPELLYPGERAVVVCSAPGALLCADTCAKEQVNATFEAKELGAYPLQVNATADGVRGHSLVTFIVVERPTPRINASTSPILSMDDMTTLAVTVRVSKLTHATVTVSSGLVAHEWEVPELTDKEFVLEFPAALLDAGENDITITVRGSDKNDVLVEATDGVTVTLPASTWEKVQLFFLHLFA